MVNSKYVQEQLSMRASRIYPITNDILKEIQTAETGAPTRQTILPLTIKHPTPMVLFYRCMLTSIIQSYNPSCRMCQLKYRYIPEIQKMHQLVKRRPEVALYCQIRNKIIKLGFTLKYKRNSKSCEKFTFDQNRLGINCIAHSCPGLNIF